MKPVEFHDVGVLLRSSSGATPEGRERSAISRYYYAAFLEAMEKLREKRGFEFRKHEAHEHVKRALYFSTDRRVKTVGRLLDDLKKLRLRADYAIETAHDTATTGEAEAMSVQIRAELAAPDFNYSACDDPDARP